MNCRLFATACRISRELVNRFLATAAERHGKSGLTVGEPLLARLRRWHWPGNVDELEILVERLTVIAAGHQLSVEDLPEQMNQDASAIETLRLELPADGISLEAVERELLMRSLERFKAIRRGPPATSASPARR